LGWAGVDQEGLHVHSHMVAALPDRRHKGVGYALKLAQRADALDRGIDVMRWTFDPMVARNAWFNLGKLGTVADRFFPDFYGEMTDAINAGDRSDRLVARWDLARDPGPRDVAGADTTVVPVPAEYGDLRAEDAAAATAERDRVRAALIATLGAGSVVAAFDRTSSAYVVVRREDLSA
jgi:predicted GNAT superfamily acetyltransferase